jgi:soluble lytic murein transglycosylase-like protein
MTAEEQALSELPWDLINKYAALFKLDPALVGAVVMTESAGDEWAVRIELHWQYYLETKKFARLNRITEVTERALQACSWGLMQVMGSVAREHNYSGPLHKLADPDLGLRYGCKHLAKFVAKHPNINDAIASYNAGAPVKGLDGRYKNNEYVVKVCILRDTIKSKLNKGV